MAKGYSPQQIVRYLREAEGKLANGSTIPEVAREIGISETTWFAPARSRMRRAIHRWKRQYGGMSPEEAKRLKELEKENARLKKMVAEQAMDIDMLKEINRGNF